MSIHTIGHGTGDPVRLPARMTRGEEFLALMDQRRRIDARLNELAESLGADPISLPKSGLRLVAVSPTAGGRDHG